MSEPKILPKKTYAYIEERKAIQMGLNAIVAKYPGMVGMYNSWVPGEYGLSKKWCLKVRRGRWPWSKKVLAVDFYDELDAGQSQRNQWGDMNVDLYVNNEQSATLAKEIAQYLKVDVQII